jgi:glycosyltransferase 2 family protein
VAQTEQTKKTPLLRWAIALLITATLVSLLYRYVDIDQMTVMVRNIDWQIVAMGFAIYCLSYLLRAYRFIQLSPRTPFFSMLSIVAAHSFMLRVLPARSGELVYAFLVKRTGTGGMGESVLNLVLLRLFDVVMVVLFFSVALAFDAGVYLGDVRLGIIYSSILGAIGLICILAYRRLLHGLLSFLVAVARLARLADRPRVKKIFDRARVSIASFDKISLATVLMIAVLSLFSWACIYALSVASLRALGVKVTVAQAILGSTGSVISAFLPISAIGTFGAAEAGWALGFALVGFTPVIATSTGIAHSALTLGFSFLLTIPAWLILAGMKPAGK